MIIDGHRVITLDDDEDSKGFSIHGCENCGHGLGMDVYDCRANIDLKVGSPEPPEYIEVRLCHDCIYAYHYGEGLPDDCQDVYEIYGQE